MSEVHNLEPNRKQMMDSTIKALIATVPTLGGTLSSLLGDYQNKRKTDRIIEFINGLKEDLDNAKGQINNKFIAKDDFTDIFEQTANRILITRQETKRKAYRKILSKSIISTEITYDDIEYFLTLIDKYRDEHILLLSILNDPLKYDENTGNRVGKGGGFSTSISEILSRLLPDWEEDSIIDIATELENDRLVQNIISRFKTTMTNQGIYHLIDTLTSKGKRFVSFIL